MGLGFGVSLVGFGWFRAEFAGRNRCLKNLGPAVGRSQSLPREPWAGDRLVAITESISNNLSVTLNIHFDFMSISLRVDFDVTASSTSLRILFGFTLISHRLHFGFKSTSLQFRYDFILNSHWCHFDLTAEEWLVVLLFAFLLFVVSIIMFGVSLLVLVVTGL